MKHSIPTQNLLEEFSSSLSSHSLSKSTIKFYQSDTATFLRWIEKKYGEPALLSREALKRTIALQTPNLYKEYLVLAGYPTLTINRKLSALRHFLQFIDPVSFYPFSVDNIRQRGNGVNTLVEKYKTHLANQKSTSITIKNYISDINSFEKYLSAIGKDLLSATTREYREYMEYLGDKKSSASIKRASAAIRKFLEWHNPIDEVYVSPLPTVPTSSPHVNILYIIGIILIGGISYIIAPKAPSTLAPKDTSLALGTQTQAQPSTFAPTHITIANPRGQDFSMLLKDDSSVELKLPQKENLGSTNQVLLSTSKDTDPYALIYSEPTLTSASQNFIKTAGKATLKGGKVEQVITNPLIQENSLIYLTPTASTQGKMLFVKEAGIGYFIIGLDIPLEVDISFNWFILN